MPGISDIHVRGDVLGCQLDGDPQALVAALQGVRIHDLLIEPARLEEAFMEYYADDDAPSGPATPDPAAGPDGGTVA